MLALASVVSAQNPLPCGIVDIVGLSDVEPGVQLVFKVTVTKMPHTSKPEFKWKVSAGTITLGQGTAEITVDTTGLGGQGVTATVELTDVTSGCQITASTTTQVKSIPITCGMPFDTW